MIGPRQRRQAAPPGGDGRRAAVPSLVFVANARLPTEKAHGHAIVRLCEAFARLGCDVELWHPRRHQPEGLRDRDVFGFYGVDPVFKVRTLPNLDVVRLDPLLPAGLFLPFFVAHEAIWARYAARWAARRGADLYITRDVLVAHALARRGLRTVLDVHVVPQGIRRHALARLARLHVAFLALTEGNRTELAAAGVPPTHVTVVGSAVDPARFADLPPPEQCRELHGLPLDRPIVGYVGRFETLGQEKGIATLVRGVGLLAARSDHRPFLVCVGGPLTMAGAYLLLAGKVGLTDTDVRFVDHVPAQEVPTWIRALDVGVALYPPTHHMAKFASQFTSPLKLYEYMAAGIRILTSDLPTTRAVLGDYPAAFFTPSADPAVVADVLAAALRAPVPLEARSWPVPTWEDRARTILNAATCPP